MIWRGRISGAGDNPKNHITSYILGETLISAIAERDYPVIQAGAVIFAFFVVFINLLIDIAYIVIDPRIRVQ